jgi:hypothetical protein
MTKTISISAPAPARLALEALAALLELKLVVAIEETKSNASPVQCQLFVEETHPLTCVSTRLEVKGWMPCIKYLCLHSVLWGEGDDSPLTQAQVEAWLLEGEAHLLQKGTYMYFVSDFDLHCTTKTKTISHTTLHSPTQLIHLTYTLI